MVPQVKIKWRALPSSCDSWEHLYAIVNMYPTAPAWGQADSAGEGNVTTQYMTHALKEKRRTDRRREIREAHLRLKPTAQKTIPTQDYKAGSTR